MAILRDGQHFGIPLNHQYTIALTSLMLTSLNSLLEGSASDATSGLKLTAANYGEAISILKKRFGNKQQIIAKHMNELLNIDAVISQYNLKGL